MSKTRIEDNYMHDSHFSFEQYIIGTYSKFHTHPCTVQQDNRYKQYAKGSMHTPAHCK